MQIGRVAAGAIAEKWLARDFGIEIVAWVSAVGHEELALSDVDIHAITRADVSIGFGIVPISCRSRIFLFLFFLAHSLVPSLSRWTQMHRSSAATPMQ